MSVEKKGDVWSKFSWYSYRFERDFNEAFPDRTQADWTGLFVRVMSLHVGSKFSLDERDRMLSCLVKLFADTGRPVAKRMVEQMLKTPQNHVILFGKQAFRVAEDCLVDGKWVQDDKLAMKAARLEVTATQALIDASIPDLFFPLVVAFSYRKKRVMCSSLLPINGKETLVQGRLHPSDPVLVPDDDKVAAVMKTVAANLMCGLSKDGIFGPRDLQLHRGTDGRLYLVNVQSLLVPESASGNGVLRLELLRRVGKLLEPDAFLTKDESALANIQSVTQVLHGEIGRLGGEIKQGKFKELLESPETVKNLLHSRGINMRFLPKLVSSTKNARLSKCLELIGRKAVSEKLLVPPVVFPEEIRRVIQVQETLLRPCSEMMQIVPNMRRLALHTEDSEVLEKALKICKHCDPEFDGHSWTSFKSCSLITVAVLLDLNMHSLPAGLTELFPSMSAKIRSCLNGNDEIEEALTCAARDGCFEELVSKKKSKEKKKNLKESKVVLG